MEVLELESCVPPGFRFHPTEEELVGYYLARKVSSQKIDLEVITDVDLYRIEPWDLQEKCKLGYDEQKEWYFFSHKDKKYPTGTRTNRATAAGFWKATGRDKAVLSKTRVIGMRKTLVFYVGRAPNGRKSDWIIHEYRLQSSEHEPPQEEGWVVCRAFMKQIPNVQRPCFNTYSNPNYYNRNHEHFGSASTLSNATRNTQFMDTNLLCNLQQQFRGIEGEFEFKQSHSHVFDNPRIESSSMSLSLGTMECFESNVIGNKEFNHGQIVDWKTFDKLLTPQSSEHASYSSSNVVFSPLDCDVDAQDPDNFLASFDN